MKKTIQTLSLLLTLITLVFSVISCGQTEEPDGLWANAIYTENATLGEGDKTVEVEIKAEDKSVTLTVKTDEQYLGAALVACGVIEGEQGPYGLYVKRVNGILADYDVDGSYWSFYKNGEYMLSGVDTTEISDGEHYEIVYTK